jgi:hypothetical protein
MSSEHSAYRIITGNHPKDSQIGDMPQIKSTVVKSTVEKVEKNRN